MEFTVEERLATLALLPPEGSLVTMKIIHDLRQALAFSEEELAVLQFQQNNDQLTWQNGVGLKEVEVGPQAVKVVRDLLKKLDEDEKIREAHLSLVEKFGYVG